VHKDVDAFIGFLPDHLVPVGEKLREMIYELVPEVEEKVSFHTPFYHYYGFFCYLSKLKDGIEICFCRGKDILWGFPQLEMKKRVLVGGITVKSLDDIKRLEIQAIIAAAATWQKEAYIEKIPLVKPKKRLSEKKKHLK
jgi:hypothetical protein